MISKLATQLLQVFGYINATEADVIPLESGSNQEYLDYILVEFYQKRYQFNRIKYSDRLVWEMQEGV